MLGARPNAPGFTYDGRHSSEFHLVMLRSPISMMPSVEPKLIQVPGRIGAYLGPVQIRERTIRVEVAIWAATEQSRREMARAIASWLDPMKGARALSFDTEPGKVYRAVLNGGIDIEQAVIGRSTLEFVAPDPFAYGTQQTVRISVSPTTVFLQPSFPADYSLNQFKVDYPGTAFAYPVFEVTFAAPVNEFKITHEESGQFVRIVHSFAAGDTLVIDHEKLRVLINGVNSLSKLDLSSDFFVLQSGQNTLSVSPIDVANTTLKYVPRWL